MNTTNKALYFVIGLFIVIPLLAILNIEMISLLWVVSSLTFWTLWLYVIPRIYEKASMRVRER